MEHHLTKPYRVDYECKRKSLLKSEMKFEWLYLVRGYERKGK
jgi:hypothetical protein